MKKPFYIIIISNFIFAFVSAIYIHFYFWIFLAIILNILIFISYNYYVKNISRNQLFLFLLGVYLYLPIATIFKIILTLNLEDKAISWINITEHLLWAFSLTILAYPLVKVFRNVFKQKVFEFCILFICITLVGIFNEIFEYFDRELVNLDNKLYIFDTIKDLLINILGSIAASLLIFLKRN